MPVQATRSYVRDRRDVRPDTLEVIRDKVADDRALVAATFLTPPARTPPIHRLPRAGGRVLAGHECLQHRRRGAPTDRTVGGGAAGIGGWVTDPAAVRARLHLSDGRVLDDEIEGGVALFLERVPWGRRGSSEVELLDAAGSVLHRGPASGRTG